MNRANRATALRQLFHTVIDMQDQQKIPCEDIMWALGYVAGISAFSEGRNTGLTDDERAALNEGVAAGQRFRWVDG